LPSPVCLLFVTSVIILNGVLFLRYGQSCLLSVVMFAFSSLFVVCPICVPFKLCSMFALVAVLPALVLLFVSRFTSVIVFMVFWFLLVAFLPSPVCLLFCHICDHFKWYSMFALVAVLPALVLLFVSCFTSVIVFMVFWFVLVAFLPSLVCLLFVLSVAIPNGVLCLR